MLLEHIFSNHTFCTKQCLGKKAFLKKEEFTPNILPLNKKMHHDICVDLLEVTAPYFEPD
eukprot:scaffold265642_cov35-Attheya_sp.AAC.2